MEGMLVTAKTPGVFCKCQACGLEFATDKKVIEAETTGEVYSSSESDGHTYAIVYYHKCGNVVLSNIVETDGFDY